MKTTNTKLRPLALAGGFVALMGSVGAQAASIPGLFNTGAGFAQGAIDTRYVLDGPGVTYDGVSKVTYDNKWPVVPGPWLDNNGTSRWLTAAIAPSQEAASVPPGTYTWTYTFDLTGYVPSTASLAGRFSSDNNATVSLNGSAPIGTSAYEGFGSWFNFGSNTNFVSGFNTLTFAVTNGPGNNGNPAGLRVEFTESSVSAVPLPPAALLFGSVLLGAGVFGRKKLFNKSDSQAIAG